MNAKRRKTLTALFDRPTRGDIRWEDIEALVVALGGAVSEARGSRVVMRLGERRAVFHRPHPRPVTDKGTVEAVRRLLDLCGVKP